MNLVMALVAFGTLAAFLGILILKITTIDLVIVVLAAICFVAWDFFTSIRDKTY
jgi:hypothetical protein